jgi:hypothetical protein
VPGQDYWRVDDLQKSPRTKMESEDTMSSERVGVTVRRGYVHGIAIRVQLKELVLGPLSFPRWIVAGEWGRFFGVNIIVAEAMYGIFSVLPLQFPNEQNQDHQ